MDEPIGASPVTDAICVVTFFSVVWNVRIFSPTYGAVVSRTTIFASAFAAFADASSRLPVTVTEMSGAVRAAPVPVWTPTTPTET